MSNDIEKLPRLIERAAAALAKATTAGEFLEAKDQADVAYMAAKTAARLTKIRDAHDTVLSACRKAMADALVIESRAQVRLADEYDAAQARGDVQRGGNKSGKTTILNENSTPTVIDIGLTSKQVHEARQIRDAEKAKPGIIRKTVDQKLQANEEPTRADVKRAIKPKQQTESKTQRREPKAATSLDKVQGAVDQLVRAGKGVPREKLAAEYGVGERTIQMAAARARGKLEAEREIHPEDLSMTAQQKLDAAIRQHKHKLDLEFEQRVSNDVRRRIDEIILPHWKQKIDQAQQLYARRKALMDKETFNKIRRALHPDSRNSISDKMLGIAFDEFMALEKFLLNEKDSPTTIGDLPDSLAEWDKLRVKKSQKANGPSSVRTRW